MIKIKKLKPMFTSIITTKEVYEDDVISESGLIDSSKVRGTLKEFQTVVAVGDAVRNVKVGDLIKINPIRYGVRKHQEGSLKDGVIQDNPVTKYEFNVVEMNDEEFLLLQDRDVEFVIEEWEEVPLKKVQVENNIILPEPKKIIV